MAGKTESTMTWKLDIKDLKAGMQEARRAISQANAEFKKSTAGMDSWGKSTDGVKAKITQLKTVLTNQKTILEQLNKQYDITAKEMGEDSAEAQRLKTQITNQEAAIKKTEASIKNYNSKLNDMEAEEKEANSATGKLTKEIEEQQKKVDKLKAAYKESLVGKNPEEAKKLKKELKNASDELSKSKSKMNDADRAADKLAGSLDKSSDKAKQAAKGGFTVLKGALANLVSQGISKVTSAITENLDGAIERVDTLNAYKRTMENLGYATEDVADAQQKLKDGVQGLPTTLPQIVSMQKQYAALTGDLGKSTDLTLALNNATLAAGAGADEASRAAEHWYKIISAGKPELENWKEINSIMPAQMNQIAESIMGAGKKANDLRDAWKAGTVTTEQVMGAIIKLDKEGGGKLASFSQQAQDASGGIGTSLTNIKVAIQTQLANMIEAIGVDKISAALGKVKEYVGIVGKAVTDKIKEMMPKIKEIIKVVIDNKDKIIRALGFIAAAIATAFVVKKVFDFITALKGLAKMLNTVLGVIKNIFITNPWLLLIAGIAAAVAAIVIFVKKSDEAKRAQHQLTEEQKKQIDVINENADAYKELNDSRNKAMDDTVSEYNHLESLINEYNAHVDANGKVQDSYKGRADFILNELAKAFGMEVDEIKKLIDENGKLGESIQNVMNLKRAEALLNANQEAYNEAIKNQTNAWKEYADAQNLVNDRTRSYNAALAEVNNFKEKGKPVSRDARIALEEEEKALNEAREACNKAKETWQGYNQTIQNYEGLGAAIQTKDADKIANAMAAIRYSLLTAENADRASLERQKKDFETQLAAMKKAADEEGSGISDSMIEEMERMVRLCGDEIAKSEGIFLGSGEKSGENWADGYKKGSKNNQKAGKDGATEANKGAASVNNQFSVTGCEASDKYSSGLEEGTSKAYNQGLGVAKSGKSGMSAVNPYPEGTKAWQDFNRGLSDGKTKVTATGKQLAQSAKNGAAAISFASVGINLARGLMNGMGSMFGLVGGVAGNLAQSALNAMKKKLGIASPSKRAEKEVGVQIGAGVEKGLQAGVKGVQTASKDVADASIDAMADALGIHSPSKVAKDKIGKNLAQGVIDGLKTSENKTVTTLRNQIKKWWSQIDDLNKKKSKTTNKTTIKNYENQIKDLKKKIDANNKKITQTYNAFNNNLIDAALTRVSNLKKYDRITLEQEITYWEKIAATTKKGTAAESTALGELKLAKRAYAEYLTELENKSVSDLQAKISRLQSLDKITLKKEVEYWEALIKTLKAGTAAYKEAEVELYQAKKALAQEAIDKQNKKVSDLQAYISRENSLDRMTLKTEVKKWEALIKTLDEGSEAYLEAEVALYQAKKALAQETIDLQNQVVSDLQSYISRMNSLDKMTASEEVKLWEEKIKTIKKGTQAYEDAEVALYQARKALAQETADAYNQSVTNLQSYISRMNSLDKMTVAQEVEKWQELIKTLKKGTQAYQDAEVALYQAKKALAQEAIDLQNQSVTDLQAYISRMNTLDKITVAQEVEKWEELIKTLKKGTQAYEDAEVALYQARKTLAQEAVDLQNQSVADLQSYISRMNSLDKITIEQEVEKWETLIKTLKKGTQAYQDAEVALYQARKNLIQKELNLQNESISNLQSYISRMNSLDRMTVSEEVKLWEDKIKTLKEGTQAYEDAEVALYQARKKLSEEQVDAENNGVSELRSYISRMNSLEQLSLKQEVDLWEKKIKTLKDGTAAYLEAEVELFKARKAYADEELAGNTQAVSKLNDEIGYLKDMDRLTISQEFAFWNDLLKILKKGTEAYQDAEVSLYKLKKEITKTAQDLTKSFADSTGKIRSDLQSNVRAIKDELNANITDLNKKLKTDIDNALKTYRDAVLSRKTDLTNAWGDLFSNIDLSEKMTKGKLTENLQNQVDALTAYDAVLSSLENKLGANSDIMTEIRKAGVDSLHTMQSLDEMTESELENYVRLYEQRSAIAGKRATVENEALKEATESDIVELKQATALDIKELKYQAKTEIKTLQDTAQKEIAELTTTFKTGLKELSENVGSAGKEIGNSITDGIRAGLREGMKDLTDELKTQTENIVELVKDELEIQSPSKVFRDEIGKMLPPGLAQGFALAMPEAERDMQSALQEAVSDLKDSVSESTNNIIPFNSGAISGGVSNSNTSNQVVNFNQTINSPKAVDRLTIYRQTNSLLFGAKVRLSNV